MTKIPFQLTSKYSGTGIFYFILFFCCGAFLSLTDEVTECFYPAGYTVSFMRLNLIHCQSVTYLVGIQVLSQNAFQNP